MVALTGFPEKVPVICVHLVKPSNSFVIRSVAFFLFAFDYLTRKIMKGIIKFWILMTVIGLASLKGSPPSSRCHTFENNKFSSNCGVVLQNSVTKKPSPWFYILGSTYAGMCCVSILHYAINPPSFYNLRIHLLLWPDVLAGAHLFYFVIKVLNRS